MFDFLKNVPIFSNLSDDDLNRICSIVKQETIPAGEVLFTEGEPGDKAYVIMEGEIEIFKQSGERIVSLATRKQGEVIGEMSLLNQAPRFASGRTHKNSKLLSISHENLDDLLDTSPSAAKVMLSTITERLRSTELILRQSEKMAQLGTLTAGIAHELNNPAAAVQRGSEHLSNAIKDLYIIQQNLFSTPLSNEQQEKISNYHDLASRLANHPLNINGVERSDREEKIENWLDSNQVDRSWEHAPILVNLDLQIKDLETIKDLFPEHLISPAVSWICAQHTIYSLLAEINQGTTSINQIIKSLKSYTYLDQGEVQWIDLHDGLEDTLVMMQSILKEGIVVERHYAKKLPQVQAYGSELNQVWTNIIDNAVDAMDGRGVIRIETRQKNNHVVVEITDSGPGIPREIQEMIFSPFFTTKAVNKGTGLGLNISHNIIQKHQGDIKVDSKPGKTSFTVQLPIKFDIPSEDS
jgi:signal transduction histidine kinase